MIDNIVKLFIENNIELIESNKWFLLFLNWYNDSRKEFPDILQFAELMSILQTVDRKIYDSTISYRKGVIITITRSTIDDIRKNMDLWLNGNQVSLDFLVSDLYSCLGLSEEDIINCVHLAAETEGCTYNSETEQFTL